MTSKPEHGNPAKQTLASPLDPPELNPQFISALEDLITVARSGHSSDSDFFNPDDSWLFKQMRIFQEMSHSEQSQILEEAKYIIGESSKANSEGKAGKRAWADAVIRLDNGGIAAYSQLGVARRPDLTQYLIEGFTRNRDSLAFEEDNQRLFAEVLPYITKIMSESFKSGTYVVQTDRQIGDVSNRSFHARQLLFGTQYPHLPYMWRQLTFDLPHDNLSKVPDILEVSVPSWLDDLGMPADLIRRIKETGVTQLVFKAPTRGVSLHLGFDYMGEHKMGPLSIAMFKVKQSRGLAVQAALSVAKARAVDGTVSNSAIVTTGPSLHGKSTLTIMIELAESELSRKLGLSSFDGEGVYPMNDDIVLIQSLENPYEYEKHGKSFRITHAIDGTENSLYAVPFGLTKEDDPITHDVLRGTDRDPNSQETLENVVVDLSTGKPDYSQNPVRNMRMILNRSRLLERKGVKDLLTNITGGNVVNSVHVPMEAMDRILWQGVMRQNTIIPPVIRLTANQYIRALMFGEAVQTGAAVGAIGRPYVEYFSDPFIIGLEDDNANGLFEILNDMNKGGMTQEFYMFNTGGVGAQSNLEATGNTYVKIPRELTLMLQEGILRRSVKFEYDPIIGVDVAVALIDSKGREIMDLRDQWLPRIIYGEHDYSNRVLELKRKRYFGSDVNDRAGILRYTKVRNDVYELTDIPVPSNEREMAWILSFFWNVDQAYETIVELSDHLKEGCSPEDDIMDQLRTVIRQAFSNGVGLDKNSTQALNSIGLTM